MMDADTPEMVEAVKTAFERCGYAGFEEGKDALARAAIAAAEPFILERAAREADSYGKGLTARCIANAIRALKDGGR